MSGLFGSNKTQSTQKPTYSGISIQQSTAGVAIPFGYGQFRAGNNIIWKNDFTTIPHTTKTASGGKGGGSGPSNTTYTYTTAVALAICEGPIQGVIKVFADQTVTTLAALNLTLMLGSNTQDPSTYMLSSHPDQAFNYRGTAYVVSGSYDLGSSANLPTHTFEIQGPLCNSVVSDFNLPDANMADIVADFLTNAQFGVGMGSAQIGDLTAYRTYCQAQGLLFSPYYDSQSQASSIMSDWGSWSNTAIFWSGDQIKFVPLGDQTITANRVTYEPNLTPLFDLTDSDYMHSSGADPVTCDRADPTDSYNHFQLEYLDRTNNYNTAIAEYKDDGFILLYGLRTASVISAHAVCDSGIANTIIQLIGRRTLYVRNTYNFKLSWEYCLLEPADIITLTDVNLGLNKFPVRIVSIEEDKDGFLSIVAEEFPASIGTATAYPHQGVNPYTIDYNITPGGINDPVIFEPTSALVGSPAVWIAASGGTNWGGCDIWISPDNLTYERRGTVSGPARQGLLTSALGAHADPDTTSVLAVSLAESRGTLSGGTQADADAFRTLIYVDGELMSYETANLTGANTYQLSYLRRGLYGTPISAHAVGAQFACLDNAIFEYPLPDAYIGIPLYFKFLSFNQFKGGQQGLEDVSPFMYTPNGNGSFINPPTDLLISSVNRLAADGTAVPTLLAAWTASSGPSLAAYELQWRIHTTGGTNPWTSIQLGPQVTSWNLTPAVEGATYDVQVRAVSGLSPPSYSTWCIPVTLVPVSFNGTVPPQPTGLFATNDQFQTITVSWNAPVAGTNRALFDRTALAALAGIHTDTNPLTAGASIISSDTTSPFTHNGLDSFAQWTYWVRFVSTSGVFGPWSAPVFGLTAETITLPPGSITTIELEATLAQTVDQFNQSTGLSDDLDALATAVSQMTMDVSTARSLIRNMGITEDPYSGEIITNNIQIQIDNGSAALTSEQAVRASADTAIAASVTTLNATVTTNNTTVNASITTLTGNLTTEQSVRASADAVLTTNLTSLTSTVTTNNTTITGNLTTEQSVRASADSVLTTNLTSLTSTVTTNNTNVNASITTEATTRATADTANTNSISSLSTTVGSNFTTLNSAITATTTTANSAISQINTLTASFGGNVSSMASALTATATSASSALTSVTTITASGGSSLSSVSVLQTASTLHGSQFVVKMDVNGVASGFGLASAVTGSGGVTTSFVIRADQFQIVSPGSGPGSGVPAFDFSSGNLTVLGKISASKMIAGTITGQTINVIGSLNVFDTLGNLLFGVGGFANGIIGTAILALNSVTVPVIGTVTSTVSGNNANQTLVSFNVNMAVAGTIYVDASLAQNTTAGAKTWQASIVIDGNQITLRGGTAFDNAPALSSAVTVAAGTHTVALVWYGADSTIQIGSATLYAQGIMR